MKFKILMLCAFLTIGLVQAEQRTIQGMKIEDIGNITITYTDTRSLRYHFYNRTKTNSLKHKSYPELEKGLKVNDKFTTFLFDNIWISLLLNALFWWNTLKMKRK